MSTPEPQSPAGAGRARDRERGLGLVAVVLAATAFSWGFIIAKSLDMNAASIAVWRLILGALFLTVPALVWRVRWPTRWRVPVFAGICFGLHQLLFIAATQATTIAIVTLAAAAQPLLVGLVSRRTLGEAVPRALLGWSVVAVAGVAVVLGASIDDPAHSLLGDALALANLFAFTAYFLATKSARDDDAATLTLTASTMWFALLVVVPVALLTGAETPPSSLAWSLLAVMAVVPGSGHIMLNWAHRRVPAALSSLVLCAVPLLASVWAYLVFGEAFGWRHVLGCVLVAIAVDGGRRADARHRAAAVTV